MTRVMTETAMRRVSVMLAAGAVGWAGAVVWAAESGWLARLYPPLYGPLVALGIAVPTVLYAVSPVLQAYFARVGLRALTAYHVWRIAAALLFFWYGLQGLLPPAFWILAGSGDLLSGLKALPVLRRPASREAYLSIHRFGFADFVVAVGTGLAFTLLHDPRMAPIRHLPLALIPLFGVGLSGASHLIAFDLLRRPRTAVVAAGEDTRPALV